MFVAIKENFELKLLFSNATFTGTHLHLHCLQVPLRHLCCCGSVLFRVHESVNIVSNFMFKTVMPLTLEN